MIQEKMFPNNHVIAGSTALAYNIQLTDLYEQDVSKPHVRNEFSNMITNLGFEWKKSSDTTWTRVPLKNNANDYFYSCDGDIFSPSGTYTSYGRSSALTYVQELEKVSDGKTYFIQQYVVKNARKNYELHPTQPFPIRIIIPGLEPNTSYSIRSFYTLSNGVVFYNEQTITTFPNERTLTFSEITLNSAATTALQNGDLTQERIDNFKNLMQVITQEVKDYFKWFYVCSNKTITLKINYSKTSGAGATTSGSTISFNLFYPVYSTTKKTTKSTLIHEIGHALTKVKKDGVTDTNIIKYMEFMTNAPCANWKWTGGHVYPIISSQFFSPMDDAVNFSGYNFMSNIQINYQ